MSTLTQMTVTVQSYQQLDGVYSMILFVNIKLGKCIDLFRIGNFPIKPTAYNAVAIDYGQANVRAELAEGALLESETRGILFDVLTR
jgi:hypothetical protein